MTNKFIELVCDAGNTIQSTTKNMLSFSTESGVISVLIAALLSTLADNTLAFICLAIAVTWDLIWGIVVAVKHHNFTPSKMMKKTLLKFAIYTCVASIIIVFEKGLNGDFYIGSRIVFSIGTVAEFYSSLANMSIVAPNMPLLKILRKLLASEMADKLNMSTQELESYLNNRDYNYMEKTTKEKKTKSDKKDDCSEEMNEI